MALLLQNHKIQSIFIASLKNNDITILLKSSKYPANIL